jgi:predicted nucleotidyltransferase
LYVTQTDEIVNNILRDNIVALIRLCDLYKVKMMYAFGSVCTEKFNEKSDIDLLISFDDLSIEQYTDNYFDLHYKLEDLFQRPIELLTENSLSNPYFIQGVEQTKQLIYAARN